ncbi:MAG: GNAT family N-acetyltransferase [Methanomassiliicoccales archaeon]
MKNYTIIEGDVEKDKEAILSLVHRNLSVAYSAQRYDWNHKQCPYGKALCWLAKYESTGSFVGSASLFPRRLMINEKPVLAGVIGDFSIDKSHRGYGPAIELLREILSAVGAPGYDLLYETPNERSSPVFFRIGYKEVGRVRVYIKPLKLVSLPKELLPKYLRSRGVLKIIDSCNDLLSKEKRVKDRFSHPFDMPSSFDERFDVLWEKASKQFRVVGERSSRFLNWRYTRSYAYYRILCILDDKNELGGYMVYRVKDNICYVDDMLFLPSDYLSDLLLARFILLQRKEGIGAIRIRYLGNSSIQKKLKTFNFIGVDDNTRLLLYADDLPNQSYLLDETNWYFFAGDMDI